VGPNLVVFKNVTFLTLFFDFSISEKHVFLSFFGLFLLFFFPLRDRCHSAHRGRVFWCFLVCSFWCVFFGFFRVSFGGGGFDRACLWVRIWSCSNVIFCWTQFSTFANLCKKRDAFFGLKPPVFAVCFFC
jgi:hypothetical protein